MEIAIISDNAVRLKGKQALLQLGLSSKGKIPVDCTLFLDPTQNTSPNDGLLGLVISGPGEYEVKGVKIVGTKSDSFLQYQLQIDGVAVLITAASSLGKVKDLKDQSILLVKADTMANQEIISNVNPSVVAFFAEKAEENVKSFGKQIPAVSKFAAAANKLPEEMEVVLLQ